MNTKARWTITGALAAIASALGILATLGAVDYVTPMTRAAHAQDVESIEADHATSNEALAALVRASIQKTEMFERRWRCDEISEEMLDIRRELARLDDLNERASEAWLAAEQRLEELAARWGDGEGGLKCSEFVE